MAGDVNEIIGRILHMQALYIYKTPVILHSRLAENPHHKVLHAIELFGIKIAPAIRKALGK